MRTHVTPSLARDLLARHGLRAGHRHGQHFLVDPNTVRRIVRLSGVGPGDTVLEIGPGLGSLTVALAETAQRVVAVEIDESVSAALHEVLAHASGNVEVTIADAMKADLDGLLHEPAKLVANLPYNLATPIFLRVLDEVPRIRAGLVMVQREVGERWTAGPRTPAYGSVSVRVRYRCEAKLVGDVPPTVFMPAPKVDSVLVDFRRHAGPPVVVDDERGFLAFVRAAFSHRRKTLRNSLMAAGYPREDVEESIFAAGLADRVRPQDLDLGEYAEIYRKLR